MLTWEFSERWRLLQNCFFQSYCQHQPNCILSTFQDVFCDLQHIYCCLLWVQIVKNKFCCYLRLRSKLREVRWSTERCEYWSVRKEKHLYFSTLEGVFYDADPAISTFSPSSCPKKFLWQPQSSITYYLRACSCGFLVLFACLLNHCYLFLYFLSTI